MKTFKTLIRKSDGQYVTLESDGEGTSVIDVNYPIPFEFDIEWLQKYYYENDWSPYNLIEVAVIRMDDVPSEEEIREAYYQLGKDDNMNNTGVRLIKWYKSQIFKP